MEEILKTKSNIKNKTIVDTHILDPKHAQELAKNWSKSVSLTNMFYTYYEQEDGTYSNQRASTFVLTPEVLAELKEFYDRQNKEKCTLKVYMACFADYNKDEFRKNAPAFVPMVQLHVDEPEFTSFDRCYLPNWRKSSTVSFSNSSFYNPAADNTVTGIELSNYNVSNPSKISPKSAYLFLQGWAVIRQEKIEELFKGVVYGQLPRLKYYTFSAEDLAQIISLYEENTKRELYVHLAVIELNVRTPFQFHIVLEVSEMASDSSRDSASKDSTFFEFGYPCPPYCGDMELRLRTTRKKKIG